MRYENGFEEIPPNPRNNNRKFTPVKRRYDRNERNERPRTDEKYDRKSKARTVTKTARREDLQAIMAKTARGREDLQAIMTKTTRREDLQAIMAKTTRRDDLQAIMAHVKITDVVKVKVENCVGACLAEKLEVFAERQNGGLHTKIGPLEFGMLVVEGFTKVKVHRRPRVLLFHIGDKNTTRPATGLIHMMEAIIQQKEAEIVKVAIPSQYLTSGDAPLKVSPSKGTPLKGIQNMKKAKEKNASVTRFSFAEHKKKLNGSELVIVTHSNKFEEPHKQLPVEVLKKIGTVILDDIPQWPGVSFGVSTKKKKNLLLCSLPGNMELKSCQKFFDTLIAPVLDAMRGVPVKSGLYNR